MRIRPFGWLTAAACATTLLLAGAPAQAQQLRLMTGRRAAPGCHWAVR